MREETNFQSKTGRNLVTAFARSVRRRPNANMKTEMGEHRRRERKALKTQ